MKKSRILFLACLLVLGLIAVGWVIPRSLPLSAFVEQMCPGILPADSYVRILHSGNPDLVGQSLAHLAERQNPAGVPRAIDLLQSSDDYIWISAAHYLGVCGRQEAVPYLIKSLRHTAWRADPRAGQSLRQLTGQEYGPDFAPWQEWWQRRHPGLVFDWTSHLDLAPRVVNAPPP
jgi:hypothetical protein